MNKLIYITAIMIVITKLLDCYTTIRFCKNANSETNPIASYFMKNLGIRKLVYIYFALTLIIVFLTGFWAILTDILIYKIAFIILGLIISIIKALVVYTNYTHKFNFITKIILNFHKNLYKTLKSFVN